MAFAKGDRVLILCGTVYNPTPRSAPPDLDESGNVRRPERLGTPGVILEIDRGRARVLYIRKGATALAPRAKFTREAIWVALSQLERREKIEGEDDYFKTDRPAPLLDVEEVGEDEWEDLDDADRRYD